MDSRNGFYLKPKHLRKVVVISRDIAFEKEGAATG
jgi:hypothetical protein